MLRLVQFSLNSLADPAQTTSFNRYFQPSHRKTVFKVFRNFFTTDKIPPGADPSSPKFSNVAVAYGKQPFSDPEDCGEVNGNIETAYFYNTVPGAANPSLRALVLCEAEFEKPGDLPEPDDTSKCSTIKDFATFDMDNLSATLLHEFMHYRYLVNGATSADIVDWNVDPPYSVTKILPRSGYGPYRSFYLNQKSTIPTTPQRDPRLNAENYVWFALEVSSPAYTNSLRFSPYLRSAPLVSVPRRLAGPRETASHVARFFFAPQTNAPQHRCSGEPFARRSLWTRSGTRTRRGVWLTSIGTRISRPMLEYRSCKQRGG